MQVMLIKLCQKELFDLCNTNVTWVDDEYRQNETRTPPKCTRDLITVDIKILGVNRKV